MATITDLGRSGHLVRGSLTAGKWRAEEETLSDGVVVRHIYHYSTRMLTYRVMDPSDPDYLDYSLGHHSVSDQHGMNQLFRKLCIPLYYSRAGGASIE